MLGHVAVPMVMRTTTGADPQQQQQGTVRGGPTVSANTYTVDSFNKVGSVMSPRRQYQQQQQQHHHHYPQQQLSVSVIEEELSTVSTPLMSSTASSNGSGISTLTRSGVPNPRESAV